MTRSASWHERNERDSDNACAFFKFPQVHQVQFNLFLEPCQGKGNALEHKSCV